MGILDIKRAKSYQDGVPCLPAYDLASSSSVDGVIPYDFSLSHQSCYRITRANPVCIIRIVPSSYSARTLGLMSDTLGFALRTSTTSVLSMPSGRGWKSKFQTSRVVTRRRVR